MTDIQDRMKWYNKAFNTDNCILERFDFTELYLKILKSLEEETNDFFMSFLKKECKCDNLMKCDCDSEDYIDISNQIIDIHSNCKASLDINTSSKMKSQCRIFYLTKEDEEIRLFDIYKKHIIIYMDNKKIKFTSENKMKIKNNNLHIRFDYMSFSFL